MTLKAHRLISAAKIVAYPAPDTGESFARAIAATAIASGAEEIPIVIPMTSARFPAQEIYDAAASRIEAHLAADRDVVVLCEGDPLFYGSFMYLHSRLAGRFPVEIVPGVSSPAACTAAAGVPLCARNETLTIVPAPLPDSDLRSRLAQAEAAIVIKLGRHLPRVRSVLDDLGLGPRTLYVRHASLREEEVLPLAEAPDVAPYFSMLLIPGSDAHAA